MSDFTVDKRGINPGLSPPLVSVIMNCHNGAEYLREAIDSVFSQTYQNWEIIFYDNASADDSAVIARSYGEKLKYFRGNETIPLGEARNAAIAKSRGSLIAFLDTDDKWLPQKLKLEVNLLTACPEAALCYSNVYILYASSGRIRLAYNQPQPTGEVFASFLRYYPVNLQTVIVRKEALARMPEIFDKRLKVSEEYDLFMRLVYSSSVMYLDQPTAIYRIHSRMASIQMKENYPVENEYVLGKLRSLVPDLDKTYSREVRYLQAKIGYWYAVVHMSKGQRALARARLQPHKWVAPEFMALFLTTFFPVLVWRFLLMRNTSLGSR